MVSNIQDCHYTMNGKFQNPGSKYKMARPFTPKVIKSIQKWVLRYGILVNHHFLNMALKNSKSHFHLSHMSKVRFQLWNLRKWWERQQAVNEFCHSFFDFWRNCDSPGGDQTYYFIYGRYNKPILRSSAVNGRHDNRQSFVAMVTKSGPISELCCHGNMGLAKFLRILKCSDK